MKHVYSLLAAVYFSLMWAGDLYAQLPQNLPDAAKPAAQLPQDTFLYPELEPEPGKYIVPPVVDRPLGVAGGPRITINAFELRGAQDRPEKGLSVDDIWRVIEQERAAKPEGMTIGELQELADRITDLYRQRGFVVAHAFIPVQTVEDGIVTIQVLEGILGRVLVEGNKKYDPEMLAQPFENMLGQPLISSDVESAFVRMGDYPGLTSFGVFQSGEEIGSSDLVLKVQEEKGGGMTLSLGNQGSRFTGEYVARADLKVYNMFGGADQLDLVFQQSFDPSLSDFLSYEYSRMLFDPQYRIEFGQDENIFSIDSSGTGIIGISGQSKTAYLRFRNRFERGRTRNAHWLFSVTRKAAKTFQDELLLARDNLTVVSLEYGLDFLDNKTQSFNNLVVQLHHGEPNWLGAMSAYNDQNSSRRLGSGDFVGARFDKININYTRLQTLSPTRSFLFRTLYQYTSNPLLGLEQFAMGGPDNVRAYPASEATVDRGIFVSGEHIWNAPGFADKPSPFANLKWGKIFTVSAFAEWAYGERIDPLLSEDRTASLKGWGLGAQLIVPDSFTAKLTAAWPMMDSPFPANKRRPQVFFNLETVLF